MTQTGESHEIPGKHDFNVLLVPEGRKLFFEKECLESVSIFRKVDGGDWEEIAKDTRTPYIDSDLLRKPAKLFYRVVFVNEKENNL